MEFTQNVHQSILHTFDTEHAISLLTEFDDPNPEYRLNRECVFDKLQEITRGYGCCPLGMNLIRLLEERNIISLNSEVSLSESEMANLERYAEILFSLANQNSFYYISLAQFRTILCENQYLDADGTKRIIRKKDVLNIGRALRLSIEETEKLLFRSMEEEGYLSYLKATDLIERFVILTDSPVSEREYLLKEYLRYEQGIGKVHLTRRKKQVTGKLRKKAEDRLLQLAATGYGSEEYCNNRVSFLEFLKEEATYLDTVSRTALRIYERLIYFFYMNHASVVMSGKDFFEEIRNLIYNDDAVVFKDDAWKSEWYESTLLADMYWAIPKRIGNQLFRNDLKERMGLILKVKNNTDKNNPVSIQKYDILFALFIVSSLFWEFDDTTDQATLQNRLIDFIDLANELLEEAGCMLFYLPNPMESSIALSILLSSRGVDVYGDVIDAMQMEDTDSQQGKEVIRKPIDTEIPSKKMAHKNSDISSDEWSSMERKLLDKVKAERPIPEDHVELQFQIQRAAHTIQKVWHNQGLRRVNVDFFENGTFALYLTSGSSTELYSDTTPALVHEILYNSTPFPFRYTFKVKYEKQYERMTLEQKTAAAKPNEVQLSRLHKKAILYAIFGMMEEEELDIVAYVDKNRRMSLKEKK